MLNACYTCGVVVYTRAGYTRWGVRYVGEGRRRRGMEVGEGVNVDGIGRVTPGLYLLSHFLRVWRGENANYASGFEGLG